MEGKSIGKQQANHKKFNSLTVYLIHILGLTAHEAIIHKIQQKIHL